MKKPRPLVIYKRKWAEVSGIYEDEKFYGVVRLYPTPMFLSHKQTEKLGKWLVKADKWLKAKEME